MAGKECPFPVENVNGVPGVHVPLVRGQPDPVIGFTPCQLDQRGGGNGNKLGYRESSTIPKHIR